MTDPKRKIEVHQHSIVVLPSRTIEVAPKVGDWTVQEDGSRSTFGPNGWEPYVAPAVTAEEVERRRVADLQHAARAEHAIDLCERALNPAHRTRILKIVAEDEAESERSVELKFSVEESAEIFAAAKSALEKRGKAAQ